MIRGHWHDIRAAIERDIMDGVLETGAKLPTEPELARIYGAGRHSIRRAVADLARHGHLSVEQGRGTFVLPHPMIEYTIGQRTRMRRNMTAQGIEVTGQTLGVDRCDATPRVARRLGLAQRAAVIASRRLSHADGVPVSFGTLYHDAARFPDFGERREALGSVTAVYATYGILDYLRDNTQMHARPARSDEARLLRQHPDMPVIVVRAVDVEVDGTPLSYSERIWSAARVKFNIPGGDDKA